MNKVSLIIKKELFRVFGDRKLIFSLYILPAVIMIAIYSLMGNLMGSFEKDIEEHTSVVTVVNATDDFKDVIEKSGFAANADIDFIDGASYEADKASIEDGVRNGNIDLVVKLPEDFDELSRGYANGESVMPSMDIFYNNTENYSSQAYSVFNALVNDAYKTSLLSERFGDVGMLEAFNVNTEALVKEGKGDSMFLKMLLPYMVVMILFSCVMSVGVDAIAGEKERGTLASMLISPVKRREIAAGKMIAMGILSGISAIVTTASIDRKSVV